MATTSTPDPPAKSLLSVDEHPSILDDPLARALEEELSEKILKDQEDLRRSEALVQQLCKEEGLHCNQDSPERLICSVCSLELLDSFDAFECGHIFHVNCISSQLETLILMRVFPIKCFNEECTHDIAEGEVNKFVLKKLQELFIECSLKCYIEATGIHVICPNPACRTQFKLSDSKKRIECRNCKKAVCRNCGILYHFGFSCSKYQRLMKSKLKECPRCHKIHIGGNKRNGKLVCNCLCEFCHICLQQSCICSSINHL